MPWPSDPPRIPGRPIYAAPAKMRFWDESPRGPWSPSRTGRDALQIDRSRRDLRAILLSLRKQVANAAGIERKDAELAGLCLPPDRINPGRGSPALLHSLCVADCAWPPPEEPARPLACAIDGPASCCCCRRLVSSKAPGPGLRPRRLSRARETRRREEPVVDSCGQSTTSPSRRVRNG